MGIDGNSKENEKEKDLVFANTLASLRRAHGLTQQQVADILKIKRTRYAYYEHGVKPNDEIRRKLAAIFSVSIHELMYGVPEELDETKYVFNDNSNSFVYDTRRPINLTYAQLTTREKKYLSYFRMMPENYKQKMLKDSEDLIKKLDE